MVRTSLRNIAWIVAAVSLLACPIAANAAFTLSFPDTVTVTPGGTVTAPVSVVSSPSASVLSIYPAVDLTLTSGSGTITMTSYTPGAGLAPAGTIWAGKSINSSVSPRSTVPLIPGLPASDAAKFNIDSTSGSVVANGVVLNITFVASASAVPGSTFDVGLNFNSLTTISDQTGNLSMISFDGGRITVVPEPSPALLIGLCGGLGYVGNWARRRWFARKS